MVLPRADAPKPPKPPAPTATCRTCGREVEVITNAVIDTARLYPHRDPVDNRLCHDAHRYDLIVAAWNAQRLR